MARRTVPKNRSKVKSRSKSAKKNLLPNVTLSWNPQPPIKTYLPPPLDLSLREGAHGPLLHSEFYTLYNSLISTIPPSRRASLYLALESTLQSIEVRRRLLQTKKHLIAVGERRKLEAFFGHNTGRVLKFSPRRRPKRRRTLDAGRGPFFAGGA